MNFLSGLFGGSGGGGGGQTASATSGATINSGNGTDLAALAPWIAGTVAVIALIGLLAWALKKP